LVKIPEVQKHTNKIDCGLYAIANAVELCFTRFSGGLHIEFNQQLMRDHLTCTKACITKVTSRLEYTEILHYQCGEYFY
jgi:hypothetical protein